MKPNCAHKGCEKPVKCRSLCATHYHRLLYPTNADRGINKKEYIDPDLLWEFVKAELKIKTRTK